MVPNALNASLYGLDHVKELLSCFLKASILCSKNMFLLVLTKRISPFKYTMYHIDFVLMLPAVQFVVVGAHLPKDLPVIKLN